jgi:hypothetical protein
LAYYPFSLRLVLGKLAVDEENLELEDPIHSLLPYQCQKDAVTQRRPAIRSPYSGGGGKAGGMSDPIVDGEADGLKRRSSKMPAGYARR